MRDWKYKQVGAYHCIAYALLLFYAGITVRPYLICFLWSLFFLGA